IWKITKTPGLDGDAFWNKSFDPVEGDYLPYGDATGDATVAAGEH
ncbi:unnamed protein product, partial [marine sediment metagenome]